jgi:hypothetical protein
MNSQKLNQLLRDAVTSVLEEAIYALVEQDRELWDAETQVFEALVPFSGANTGCLVLEVKADGVAPLAKEFLGCEDLAPNSAACRDATGELANIIVGQLLETWLAKAEYDIGVPEVSCTVYGQSKMGTENPPCLCQVKTDSGIRIAVGLMIGTGS